MKQPLELHIKRFDLELPLPEYQTPGAAAFDLYARVDTEIPARTAVRVPLNVAIQVPDGYWAMLVPRSSLHKRGLLPANGVGVIDPDYCGEHDEYQAPLYNVTDESVYIKKGERIVQLVIMPLVRPTIRAVSELTHPSRGGFGSTGDL